MMTFVFILIAICFIPFLLFLRLVFAIKKRHSCTKTVAFFHPYCNAGGGGERVLWCALRSLHEKYPDYEYVIYTGDVESSPLCIKNNAKSVFNIAFSPNLKLKFVYLNWRKYIEADTYPYFTLIGQSLGSIILGLEALFKFVPDICIDSMGYAFTYPIFRFLGGCHIAAYVHYPTISLDMLDVVKCQSGTFNNRKFIAHSRVLTWGKLVYYKLFAKLYGLVGYCADVVLVNSSWTQNHIKNLWRSSNPVIVFPPCDIMEFLKIPLKRPDTNKILSIGQFRPEKNHSLQIEAFAKFLCSVENKNCYKLIMVGGCRNDGDRSRVDDLHKLAAKLKVENHVQIETNISFNKLKQFLSEAVIGIHTMSNEHFGIGIVEFQASGVVSIANNSGGPKLDIVVDAMINNKKIQTGYLATSVEEYADCIVKALSLQDEDRLVILNAARKSCLRFSEQHFENDFKSRISDLLN